MTTSPPMIQCARLYGYQYVYESTGICTSSYQYEKGPYIISRRTTRVTLSTQQGPPPRWRHPCRAGRAGTPARGWQGRPRQLLKPRRAIKRSAQAVRWRPETGRQAAALRPPLMAGTGRAWSGRGAQVTRGGPTGEPTPRRAPCLPARVQQRRSF